MDKDTELGTSDMFGSQTLGSPVGEPMKSPRKKRSFGYDDLTSPKRFNRVMEYMENGNGVLSPVRRRACVARKLEFGKERETQEEAKTDEGTEREKAGKEREKEGKEKSFLGPFTGSPKKSEKQAWDTVLSTPRRSVRLYDVSKRENDRSPLAGVLERLVEAGHKNDDKLDEFNEKLDKLNDKHDKLNDNNDKHNDGTATDRGDEICEQPERKPKVYGDERSYLLG